MALLKYRDPADGLWKPVPVGGSAGAAPAAGAGLTGGVTSYEVGAGTGVTVAADTVALDKTYTDTLYSDIAHNHDVDYVNVTGDAMTGQLGLIAPTLLTNAARWADGLPRFADAAARDAAYLSIGGPQPGMQCYLTDTGHPYTYLDAAKGWVWAYYKQLTRPTIALTAAVNYTIQWTQNQNRSPATPLTWDAGGITINHPGIYYVTAMANFTSMTADCQLSIIVNLDGSAIQGDLSYGFPTVYNKLLASTAMHMAEGQKLSVVVNSSQSGSLWESALRVQSIEVM